jgi:hypothetical protein
MQSSFIRAYKSVANHRLLLGRAAFLFLWLCAAVPAPAAEKRPIDVIEDSSFLIEEAYNQEPGIVQHISTALYSADSRRRGWQFDFTQEWPIFSQDHQLSYSIRSHHHRDGTDRIYGIGDTLLNYRYQALDENDVMPAIAPRFTLILPTGNRDRGTGDGVVGYQWGLPFSKKLGSRFAMHANLGLTYLPKVRARIGGSTGPLSPSHSLVSYRLAASGIIALFPRFHLMAEWIAEFEEDINDAGKAKRNLKPIISPGFRTAMINEEHLRVIVGAAAPIGLNRKADNFGALLYLSVEHDFR